MKAYIDREWYVPRHEVRAGIHSVKIGDHLITAGVYNVLWPDGTNEALHVEMVWYTQDGGTVFSCPALAVKHNGDKIHIPVLEVKVQMRRIK